MTRDQLVAELTATPRRQRLALIVICAPFYLAFTLGWMFRVPIALLGGAVGLTGIIIAYRRYAPPLPPHGQHRIQNQAAGEEE